MATHHATACTASLPDGCPASSPRSVSMTGVKGWYSANQRTPTGIESVGTKPLPRNGSSTRGIGLLLAVSTLSARTPSATVSQVRASASSSTMPTTPSQSATPASGR
jgi:hypothetical protein